MTPIGVAILGFVVGTFVGAVVAWLWASRVTRKRLDEARQWEREAFEAKTRLDERDRSIAEQGALLTKVQTQLKDTFEALAANALRNNSEDFLKSARERLESVQKDGKSEIEKVVTPVGETLARLDKEVKEIEKARATAYGALKAGLDSLAKTEAGLRDETSKLVAALGSPRVRGQWGEVQLRRVVEIAGMVKQCDFVEQESFRGADGRLRPDLIVKLPGGRSVVVDAKVPLQAYLEAQNAPNDEEREKKMREHARQVRSRVNELAGKSYWQSLPSAPEFVVLFLPSDTFYDAALRYDPELIEEGARGVVLATPTTLIALLKAVAYGWQQETVAKSAEQISREGRKLYERLGKLFEHAEELRRSLAGSVKAFNSFAGSIEGRVLPSIIRLKALGAGNGGEPPTLEQIDIEPRKLTAPNAADPNSDD